MRPRLRDLAAHFRRPHAWNELKVQLEPAGPILIRHSGAGDQAALERLAALESRTLPEGSFLLAGHVRRQQGALHRRTGTASRALPDTA